MQTSYEKLEGIKEEAARMSKDRGVDDRLIGLFHLQLTQAFSAGIDRAIEISKECRHIHRKGDK